MNIYRDMGNIILQLLPVSKWFGFKRAVLTFIGVRVEKGVSVNGHTWFYGRGKVRIGAGTWIGPGCRFYTTKETIIDIGADCNIAPEVSFVSGSHEIGTSKRRAGPGNSENIKVEDGCWLGTRSTVLGGVRIGSGSMVAAGSLVKSDLPPNSLAAGVPAEVRKIYED